MALLLKSFKAVLPNKEGEYLYYPRLVKTGTADTREVIKKIAWATSLTIGDVFNVLHSLPEVMSDYLLNSQSVKLDGLGTFTIIAKANGTGVKTEEEVGSAQITSLRCQFTPEYTRNVGGKGITTALLSNVKYKKLSSLTGETSLTEDNYD